MARPPVITRTDIENLHPGAPVGFVPTHRVQVFDPYSHKTLRSDFVKLGEPEGGLSYACVPGDEEPVYGVLSTGLWQCFEVHGRIKVTPVRYKADYIPLGERNGLVYFVEAGLGGPVKIGWTQDVERRIAELQTANAHRLNLLGTVVGTMEDEAATHARFSHLRLEAEWFTNSPEIHQFLKNGR